jgi:hypothetical protein
MYLTDDGEVELRDSENNYLKMYAKHQTIRVELKDVEGNYIALRGTDATEIDIRDVSGNNVKWRGSQSDTRFEVNETNGGRLLMGPNVGSGVKVVLRDGTNNRLQMFGSDQGLRIQMATVDGHYLQMRNDFSIGIGTPSSISTIEIAPASIQLKAANTVMSGVVTLTHLANVVAQINATFATKQNGSGSAGGVIAEASSKVSASD